VLSYLRNLKNQNCLQVVSCNNCVHWTCVKLKAALKCHIHSVQQLADILHRPKQHREWHTAHRELFNHYCYQIDLPFIDKLAYFSRDHSRFGQVPEVSFWICWSRILTDQPLFLSPNHQSTEHVIIFTIIIINYLLVQRHLHCFLFSCLMCIRPGISTRQWWMSVMTITMVVSLWKWNGSVSVDRHNVIYENNHPK